MRRRFSSAWDQWFHGAGIEISACKRRSKWRAFHAPGLLPDSRNRTDGSAIDLLGPLCNTFRHESAETFLEYVFFPHLVFGRIFTANFDQMMIQNGLRLAKHCSRLTAHGT